jgi:hypothetical protein
VFAVTGRPVATFTDHREIEAVEWWPLSGLPVGDSNVDVSIFRTLMRSMPNEESAGEFIDSKEAQRKILTITKRLS